MRISCTTVLYLFLVQSERLAQSVWVICSSRKVTTRCVMAPLVLSGHFYNLQPAPRQGDIERAQRTNVIFHCYGFLVYFLLSLFVSFVVQRKTNIQLVDKLHQSLSAGGQKKKTVGKINYPWSQMSGANYSFLFYVLGLFLVFPSKTNLLNVTRMKMKH